MLLQYMIHISVYTCIGLICTIHVQLHLHTFLYVYSCILLCVYICMYRRMYACRHTRTRDVYMLHVPCSEGYHQHKEASREHGFNVHNLPHGFAVLGFALCRDLVLFFPGNLQEGF